MNETPKFEFEFTQDDFDALRNVVTRETGIQLPDHKKQMMYSRLVRRIRELKLDGFPAYRRFVEDGLRKGDEQELMALTNAMTTNVTAFFREQHHFDHLKAELPKLIERFGPRLNIWSSACSTGEEPWSIAMVLNDFKKTHPDVALTLWCTDLDTTAVERAQAGTYWLKPEVVNAHPLLKRYLKPTGASPTNKFSQDEQFKVADELRPLLRFKQMNLLKPWPMLANKFHVVFCRNVIIYFDKETQRSLFLKYQSIMPAHSLLYIGHSESLLNVSDKYQLIGTTTYERKEAV